MNTSTTTRRVSAAEIADALGMHSPTPEQAAVLAADAEPSLVVAGAGSGKTETMAARVVWLVANGIVAPDAILGLTFTRKAARQLAERVRSRLRRLAGSGLLELLDPSGTLRATAAAGEPTVLTYHAYAGRLLAEHGLRLPLPPGPRLLSETASWRLAHSVVSTWDADLETDKVPASVTAHVRALAGELGEHLLAPHRLREYTAELCELIENAPRAKGQREALPAELRDIVGAQRLRTALLDLVDAYQQRKRADGALDFADQMSLAARLAAEHPEVAAGERERYGAVLLDEYQDTGHAQRVLLRSLFGTQAGTALPVTAVGDPTQAIYGWRGASAANLPRFATDFPRVFPDGELVPAETMSLLTSFRNPPEVLTLANLIAEPLRARGLGVDRLRARDGAERADIQAALLSDVRAEREWIADELAARWLAERAEHDEPPTAAVLVRRRADMAPLAAALRARGLPVEVVGIGGLLDEPEVSDLVATLRALADPLAGTAAARLLTGARWRLGAADLAALWRRAGELAAPAAPDPETASPQSGPGERAEETGLVDALDDPGDPQRYSDVGYRRIRRLGAELAALRGRMDQSLPELVADVERTTGVGVEALARPEGAGRAHLDAFADVVSEYAESSPTATLISFLDYLTVAEHAEDGLAPGETAESDVEVAAGRVQLLTVHAAKGLEWRIVAVPHLAAGVFPGKRRTSSWLKTVPALPAALRGDAADLPGLDVHPGYDRKEIQTALEEHEADFAERHRFEERRLCYVALTRSERTLLVSGHWWGEGGARPKGPSEFLTEIAGAIAEPPDGSPIGRCARWADEPAEGEPNPLVTAAQELDWPADPLGERRQAVAEGAELVRAELDALRVRPEGEPDVENDPEIEQPDDPDGWIADTDVLLAERARAGNRADRVDLPGHLSVSQLVDLAGDPDGLARKLRRPLPSPPNAFARRGTAFHSWLERRFAGEKLLEFDDLPGAADDSAVPAAADDADDTDSAALREAFERSEWAARTPHEVEVPFSTDIDGVTVRGRMDAVFADADGGWTVVDWKTGAVPDDDRVAALSVQLAAYRLAWAGLSGTPLARVRAAFHYVRHDRTLRPVDLLDADGLRELLRAVPRA